MDIQPPALPNLPSSRTRSKTANITSMGEALIATGLSDTSSDAIVILSDTMHGDTPPQDDPKTHKDAVAHKDKDAWLWPLMSLA